MIVEPKDASDFASVGGKGAALARLDAAGFAPPAFFVILPEAFSDDGPAPGLIAALPTALNGLGPGPYAVRSSGQSEDSADHSHAGQYDTVLNVAAEDVIMAAHTVWRSGFSDRVATYAALKSGTGSATPPAIVVQRMIDARVSGIAFSADPVSGLRNRTVISAIPGLGDALVSGETDGHSWTLEGAAVLSAPDADPVLGPDEVQQVAALARAVEKRFEAPQDIEWAIDADGLHILQARPITTPLLDPPTPDETLTLFDNSNIVESYPGMVSPLTYSFATHVYARVYRAFVRLLGVGDRVIAENGAVFDNMLGRRDGRVYYNLVNWYRALALLPGFALNRGFMETMMGVSEPLPAEVVESIGPPPPQGLARVLERAKVMRVGMGLLWAAVRLPATRRDFYRRLNAALDTGLDLASASPTALVQEYRRIESDLLDRWDAPLINDFLCMIAFGASRKLLEGWLGADGLALHNDVMIGQGDIVSAEPAQRIRHMGTIAREAGLDLGSGDVEPLRENPALATEFDAYLAKFSDRCTEELKLESIPLRDDPSPLVFAIAASAARESAHVDPPQPDWDRLFARRPLRKWVARAVIGWTKARVRDRENLRFERTRVFGRARQVFLALGREFVARGAIEETRDVFYLTKDEVLGSVEGFALSPDLKGLVALRKAEDLASAARPDPEERIDVRGPAALSGGTSQVKAEDNSESERMGTGCSAGRVEARARVIRDPKTESLDPGDILVARHTDPGWIAVFSNASAIVVERGSLLSHSAIVARELGIPCVVGLKNATTWIQDGDRLEVDGKTGRVARHAKL